MMERLLKHPTWLRVFSVALAILLWVMVIRQYNGRDTKLLEVPLHVINHPEFQLEDGPRDRERFVTVRVDGTNLLVSRLSVDQLNATVDYSKVTEPGRQQEIEVQVTGPKNLKGLTYTATPRTFPVLLIKNQEGLFPVQVDLPTSVVPQGTKEWTVTAKPASDKVRLVGSSVLLATVSYVRVALDIADLVPGTEKVTKKVIPTTADGKSVNLPEQSVDVLLTWKEQPPGKTFAVKPVTKGSPPAGITVGSVTAQPASLQVRAATLGEKLPEQAVIETEPIDLTGRTKTFTVSARLLPPTGTTISTYTVNITVNLTEVVQERTLKGVPLAVRGKASGAEVTTSITDVQVRVSGAYAAVTGLDLSQISAYVDVEGLGNGKHALPVKVDAPPALTVVDVDPTIVDVNIVSP